MQISKKIVLMFLLGVVFIFLGCGQGEKDNKTTQDESQKAAEAVTETASEPVQGESQKAAEAVTETAGEVAEAVEGKNNDSTENLNDSINKSVE